MRFGHLLLTGILGLAPFTASARMHTCLEEANDYGPFTIFQAQRLCTGAMSTMPAFCGKYASRDEFDLSSEDAVRLCVYAQTTAPLECALDARSSRLVGSQISTVCNQAQSIAPSLCAKAAMKIHPAMGCGVITNSQAVELCFGSVDLTPVYCAMESCYRTRNPLVSVQSCRAYNPIIPGTVVGGGGFPFPAGPQPFPTGGGQFVSCRLKTARKPDGYQGIGFTDGQATAAARDQCLQVESVLECDAGRATCP